MHGSRVAGLMALALLVGAVVWRQYSGSVSAADGDTSAWGATDPTWSPDGKQLAFSLFGSIWQVAAEGGQAQQLSTSPGYHAHPAWSPRGDWIVFVSGPVPAGRIPNISGRLRLVKPSTGEEREIATPQQAAGTPAWSPDGSRLVCGLRMPNFISLLHEVRIEDGSIRQIQQPTQRGAPGAWIDAAWSRDGKEIYFMTSRNGPQQIWSMPAGGSKIMVQLPLTAYRPGEIALLHSLAALPDGVVYSADVVNGKGDYELYRVARNGGRPLPLTNTPRDEFAPAASPDGKSIAYVSNQPGNIDLFVMPAAGGSARHVRITGLQFRKPSGRVRVKVVDENGQQTAARLHVIAADGKTYVPAGAQVFYYPIDPNGGREGFFVAGGDDEFPAPAGTMKLTAIKGVEYRVADRTVDVPAGDTATVTIQLERWTNWNVRGWYTGENHFHANYGGSYYQRPPQSLGWLEAEDLNAANMIVANSEGAFIHDKEFFSGGVSPISKPRYVLFWGQEYRNSDPLGHMAFLNIKKQVPPSYTSVIGSDSSYDFPLNTMAALEAKRQGGVVSYVHPIGGQGNDVFDTGLGAKEAPLTAALGGMDAIDIMPFGPAAFEMWYRFLNSGFRIAPGAGTDVFTNWRGINSVPGGARQYVEVSGPMDWNRWIERYRQGRAFVTNAPLLAFSVNGNPAGAVINVAKGQPYTARISAEVSSRVPLSTIEVIQNGGVIESKELGGATSGRIEKEVQVSRSCWLAVRAAGPGARGVPYALPRAHSGAVYVHVGNEPVLVREDIELMIRWLDRLWRYLDERNNFGPGDNHVRARAMFDQGFAHYKAKLARLAQ